MPENLTIFTAAHAGTIFSGMWDVVSGNFAGVAVLLGGVAGLALLAALINGARNGKVRTGVR